MTESHHPLPRALYLEKIPKKICSAGVLFTNAENEILLLEPTYKDAWEIPGGVVEQQESPRLAAMREVKEEIGLNMTITKPLCIDYKPFKDSPHDAFHMIFDGGTLSPEQIKAIQLDPNEIKSIRFISLDDLPHYTTSGKCRRLAAALAARENNTLYYLENSYRL
jgi:8-oxo-dGTP diphosphatase